MSESNLLQQLYGDYDKETKLLIFLIAVGQHRGHHAERDGEDQGQLEQPGRQGLTACRIFDRNKQEKTMDRTYSKVSWQANNLTNYPMVY